MLIRSNIWIRLKHISSTLSTSQGPFLTNWRWAPSSVWSPHFDVHVTFTFSFWGLIANIFFVLLHESLFHSLFLRTNSFVSRPRSFHPFPFLFMGVSRETFQLFWFSSFGSKYQCSNWISQLKCFFYSPALTRSFKFPLLFEMPSLLLWNSKPPKYAPQHAFKFSSMSPSGRR